MLNWGCSLHGDDGCRIVENGAETTTVEEDGVITSRMVKPVSSSTQTN